MKEKNIRKIAAGLALLSTIGLTSCSLKKETRSNTSRSLEYSTNKNTINSNYEVVRIEDNNSILGDYYIREISLNDILEVNDYYAKVIDGEYYIYQFQLITDIKLYDVNSIDDDVEIINNKNYVKNYIVGEKKEELKEILIENQLLSLK